MAPSSSRSGLFILFANHQTGQFTARGITDFNQLANPGHAWLNLFTVRLDDTVNLVVTRTFADYIECLEVDQLRGCSRQMIFGIRRVILMRGQHPDASRLHHLERVKRCQLFVILDDFQTGRFLHISKFGKQHPFSRRLHLSRFESGLYRPAEQQQQTTRGQKNRCPLHGRVAPT